MWVLERMLPEVQNIPLLISEDEMQICASATVIPRRRDVVKRVK